MENIKYTIYKLIDPVSKEIRYVGLTFNKLSQRLKSHCSENSKSHKSNWIKKLRSLGHKPIIESIEDNISSYDYCCEREIYWIKKLKEDGHPLTNMATGGNKNKKMSQETRKKMSVSAKKRKFKLTLSEDVKRLLSINSKERFKDEREREKLRVSNRKYECSKTKEQKINDILIQNPKTVLQLDKEMNLISEFISVRDAERRTKINRSNIIKCCKGKIKSAGGYIWTYKE